MLYTKILLIITIFASCAALIGLIAWVFTCDESLIHMFLYCLAGAAFLGENYYVQKTYGSNTTKYVTAIFNHSRPLKSSIIHLTFNIIAFAAIAISELVIMPNIRIWGIIILSCLLIPITFTFRRIIRHVAKGW